MRPVRLEPVTPQMELYHRATVHLMDLRVSMESILKIDQNSILIYVQLVNIGPDKQNF